MITKKFLRRVVTERHVVTKNYRYMATAAIDCDSKYCIHVYRCGVNENLLSSPIATFYMDGRGWIFHN